MREEVPIPILDRAVKDKFLRNWRKSLLTANSIYSRTAQHKNINSRWKSHQNGDFHIRKSNYKHNEYSRIRKILDSD